jgi:hypothetical protein
MNAHTEKIRNTKVPGAPRRWPFCLAVFGTVVLLVPSADASACTVNFKPHVDYDGGALHSLEVADMNRDGKPDLVNINVDSNDEDDSVSVLLGRGDGTFQTEVDYATGWNPEPARLEVADMNRDGKPDLLTANWGTVGSSISVLLNTGP